MKTKVILNDLEVDCLIGCYPWERNVTQKIRVDTSVEIVLSNSGLISADELKNTWDYAEYFSQIKFVLQHGKFQLLETAAHFLASLFLLPSTEKNAPFKVVSAMVRLTKPKRFESNAAAQVEVMLDEKDVTFKNEDKSWGNVNIVGENRQVGLYRLNLVPQSVLPTHYHQKLNEAEYVLTDQLKGWVGVDSAKASILKAGTIFKWKKEEPHGYSNDSKCIQSLLCIDLPPFDIKDEILI